MRLRSKKFRLDRRTRSVMTRARGSAAGSPSRPAGCVWTRSARSLTTSRPYPPCRMLLSRARRPRAPRPRAARWATRGAMCARRPRREPTPGTGCRTRPVRRAGTSGSPALYEARTSSGANRPARALPPGLGTRIALRFQPTTLEDRGRRWRSIRGSSMISPGLHTGRRDAASPSTWSTASSTSPIPIRSRTGSSADACGSPTGIADEPCHRTTC